MPPKLCTHHSIFTHAQFTSIYRRCYLCLGMFKGTSMIVDVTFCFILKTMNFSFPVIQFFLKTTNLPLCSTCWFISSLPIILFVRCCISLAVKLVNLISNKVIKFQDCLKVRQFLFRGPVSGRASRDLKHSAERKTSCGTGTLTVSTLASGSSQHCVDYESVLCSASLHTMPGSGPQLANKNKIYLTF